MDPIHDLSLSDCPVCQNTGVMEEEAGWCMYVECLHCGSHTASIPYHKPEDRLSAAQQAANLWNLGKVISAGLGE